MAIYNRSKDGNLIFAKWIWRMYNREKGVRGEDITRNDLKKMKNEGILKDFKCYPNKAKPDFIVDGKIGIECKNRDPMKKNIFTRYNVEKQITSKFEKQEWKKKVLIITKLMLYPRDAEECQKLLQDFIIVEIGEFVTEDNKQLMEEILFEKLMAKKSEIFD